MAALLKNTACAGMRDAGAPAFELIWQQPCGGPGHQSRKPVTPSHAATAARKISWFQPRYLLSAFCYLISSCWRIMKYVTGG
jgi:hypothetical protein